MRVSPPEVFSPTPWNLDPVNFAGAIRQRWLCRRHRVGLSVPTARCALRSLTLGDGTVRDTRLVGRDSLSTPTNHVLLAQPGGTGEQSKGGLEHAMSKSRVILLKTVCWLHHFAASMIGDSTRFGVFRLQN